MAIIALHYLQVHDRELKHEIIKQQNEQIIELLQKRTHLDTLYWNHLEQCSFIHKDKVIIGFDGYLKVK